LKQIQNAPPLYTHELLMPKLMESSEYPSCFNSAQLHLPALELAASGEVAQVT